MISCLDRYTRSSNDNEIRAANVIDQLVAFNLGVVRSNDFALYMFRAGGSTYGLDKGGLGSNLNL